MFMLRSLFAATILVASSLATTPARDAVTFQGRCLLLGEWYPSTPAGFSPQDGTWRAVADGRCSGTLDGEPVRGMPVTLEQVATDVITCAPLSVASGEGRLVFGGPRRTLAYSVRHLAGPGFVADGAVGGRAIGYTTAFTLGSSSDPATCASGALDEAPVEIRLETIGPWSG